MTTFHADKFTQMLLIATILAGVSFSCVSQLVTSSLRKGLIYQISTGAFMIASAMFLGLLLAETLLLMNAYSLGVLSEAQQEALRRFLGVTALTFVLGLGFLLLGSVLLGWLHSRALGLVSLGGGLVVFEILRRVAPLLRVL